MLFFELVMIRWLSAEVRIFSYFHNVVLLFAFLGIGLGVGLAHRRSHLALCYGVFTTLVVLVRFDEFLGITRISTYLSVMSDVVIWGHAAVEALPERIGVFMLGTNVLIVLLALVTILFVPFGQQLGRLIASYKNPLHGYGIDLAGSLVGIWLFNIVSLLSLPPAAWFAIGGISCLALLWRTPRQLVAAGLLTGVSFALLYGQPSVEQWTVWSPYQKLTVKPASVLVDNQPVQYGHLIHVNSAWYMRTVNYTPEFIARYPSLFPPQDTPYDHYNLPYRFTSNPDHVLVVGAGAGNDVAAALRNGARRVTAVEIDPRIIKLGEELHPEAPYSDPRVQVINDDARAFFRKTGLQYDLILFGLLDSHTLSSSYSNVRLDNYVYTLESFEDAKRLLRPGGVMVVMFDVAPTDEFIGRRIQGMLNEVFGQQPVGFSVRSAVRGQGAAVLAGDGPGVAGTANGAGDRGHRDPIGDNVVGFVAGESGAISARLAADARLREILQRTKNIHDDWAQAPGVLTSDDWPYLYMQDPRVPSLYLVMYVALFVFSYLGIRAIQRARTPMHWQFFFLGAGFLLLEVQNISKLALVFGTTWEVNAIVISAILVTLVCANAYVIKVRVQSLVPYYVGLGASLVLNFALPLGALAALPPGAKELVVSTAMGMPFFFAGVIFSTTFAAAKDPAAALSSNLLGAVAGGMLEAMSFVVGVKALLILALLLYGLAFLKLSPAPTRATEAG